MDPPFSPIKGAAQDSELQIFMTITCGCKALLSAFVAFVAVLFWLYILFCLRLNL